MPNWLEVTVETTEEQMEEQAARLTMNGAEGLVLEGEADFRQFLEHNRQYWDYVDDALLERMKGAARIRFYVPDSPEGERQKAVLLQGIDAPISVAHLRDEDWATGWQKYYHPMAVGERLYIVPEWERETAVPSGRTAIYLNPGLTFGTGSHASTQMCLSLLEGRIQPGDRVLDLGCGSGILSLAALNLGAAEAIGVDIDPKAVDVAYENAALNGISRTRYLVRAGDVCSDAPLVDELFSAGPYDMVLANIVADVILSLSALAGRFLKSDGVFLCSGIIDTRAAEVEAALQRHGFRMVERRQQDGWCAFAAEEPS